MPSNPRLSADVAFALRRILAGARRVRVLIVTPSATYARRWLAECDRQMDMMRLGWRARSRLAVSVQAPRGSSRPLQGR